MEKDWWHRFFTGLWLDYQRGMDTEDRVPPAADFLETVLGLEPGARILDAPCGEGRLARELSRRGYAVSGLDASAELLETARAAARAEGLAMDLVAGDLREGFPGAGGFDLAVCWWSSFGYFSDEDNLRHVRSVARNLAPGGRFVIDGHGPETILPRFEERQWEEVGGVVALSENDYDVYTGRLITEWTLMRGAERQTLTSSMRLYTARELCDLCREAGFDDVLCFGGLEGEPFEPGCERLVFIARKG